MRTATILLCCAAAGGAAWMLGAASELGAAAAGHDAVPARAATPAPSNPVGRSANGRVTYPASTAPALRLANGSRRRVLSLLDVDGPMRFGDYVWKDEGVPAGEPWVRVDLARQMISLFRGGHEVGTAVILYGTDNKPTPTGVFPIMARARHHRSSLYDAEMPYMLRLTHDGVAIHASNVREGSATHGCIGVPEAFAARLFAAVRRGTPVSISRA